MSTPPPPHPDAVDSADKANPPPTSERGQIPSLRRPPRWVSWETWSVRLKLTVVLLLVALLPTLLVSYTNLQGSIARVKQAERINLALGAQGLARQLDQLIAGYRGMARLLAKDPDVQQFLDDQGGPDGAAVRAEVAQRLQRLQQADPDLISVYLMDAVGVVVMAADENLIGSDRGFRHYFTQAMHWQEHTSNLLQGLQTEADGVYFSAAVGGPQHPIGVAVVKLDGRAIADVLRTVDVSFTTFLVDADSVLVDHPNPEWRYRTLLPLTSEQVQAIQDVSHFPVTELRSLNDPGLAEGMTLQQPDSVVFTGPDGKPWIAGVAPLAQHDWRVYLAEPQSRFAAPMKALFWRGVWTTAAIGLLVLVLATLLARTITRPIMTLTWAAAQFKAGQYVQALEGGEVQAVARRKGALGELAQVFQSMGDEIYRREFSLDQEVRSRTRELAEKNRLLAETYQRLDAELDVARDMQQAVLPQVFPEDWRFGVHAGMTPAREMGGDFYDCFSLPGGRYGLLVADVADKGVPAAFFMAVSSTLVQEVAPGQDAPSRVLAWVNDLLCERNPMSLFVTMFYAIYDPADATLTYACAGHQPPLWRQAQGGVSHLPVANELALGVLPGQSYTDTCLQLAPGDVILMVTDGVTEAQAPDETLFGGSGLAHWLQALPEAVSPKTIVQDLESTLQEFAEGGEPVDDVTVLALKVTGTPQDWKQTWQLPGRLDTITPMLDDLQGLLQQALVGIADADRVIYHIRLCVDELLTNIITHGLNHDANRRVDVSVSRQGPLLEIRLQDDAPPFDSFAVPEPDLHLTLEARQIGGLGIHLVRSLMDDYQTSHDGRGNTVVLHKRVSPPSPPPFSPTD